MLMKQKWLLIAHLLLSMMNSYYSQLTVIHVELLVLVQVLMVSISIKQNMIGIVTVLRRGNCNYVVFMQTCMSWYIFVLSLTNEVFSQMLCISLNIIYNMYHIIA